MLFSISQFIREQRNPVPEVVKGDLQGKTVIVTGANNGIGFEAAKHFARMNPGKLIMACRNQERGEDAIRSKLLSLHRTKSLRKYAAQGLRKKLAVRTPSCGSLTWPVLHLSRGFPTVLTMNASVSIYS